MKKSYLVLLFAASTLILSACNNVDLVKGTLPAKIQEEVSPDLRQIIICFEDRIDPASLSLGDTSHIYVKIWQDGEIIETLPGDTVFRKQGFPQSYLRHGDTVDDTLVLFFKDGFNLELGKTYELIIDHHQLYCSTLDPIPEGCLKRDIGFEKYLRPVISDVYEPPYDPNDDPPYGMQSSPPDEIDFQPPNYPAPPPFPPHGET